MFIWTTPLVFHFLKRLVERARLIEHVRYVLYFARVPVADGLVECESAVKHVRHVSHVARVPAADVLPGAP